MPFSSVLSCAALLTTVGIALALPASAHAQESQLDVGIAAFELGEFQAADEALDAAYANETLDRDALARLLLHRLLIAKARGDEARVDLTLLQLASLDLSALLGRADPGLQRRMRDVLDQTEGRVIEVDVLERVEGNTVHLNAEVSGDVGTLVHHIEMRTRTSGGEWVRVRGARTTLSNVPGEVEVVAEAIGPGGAVLATHGTDDAPRRIEVEFTPTEVVSEPTSPRRRRIILAVVLSVIVVASAVTAGALLARGDDGDSIQFGGPAVVTW